MSIATSLYREHLTNLSVTQKRELVRILTSFLASLDEIEKVNLDKAPLESWGELAHNWRTTLKLMESIFPPRPFLRQIIDDGPNGNGIGAHLLPDLWKNHVKQRNELARADMNRFIEQLKNITPANQQPVIYHHGERSYSLEDALPITVSKEEDNLLQKFLEEQKSLQTKLLNGLVENVSRVMKQLNDKFPGAIRLPKGRNGYFANVKPTLT